MKNESLNKFLIDRNITLTALRQDVLSILISSNKPLGAYDILNKLKKKRPNAEPPTVYRVLEFLLTVKLIHRIESKNTYVYCSHVSNDSHKAILLLCNKCNKSFELESKSVFEAIDQFAKKNRMGINNALLEMKGICQLCFSD